ncbi:MAG: AEC family transporter [Rhodobacterales bacterium]|nr:AEC family transporter [Rhodobacterales bacterium]
MAPFFDSILPIFLVVALGYGAGRWGLLDRPVAAALNRFVYLFAVPALLFRLAARAPFADFDLTLLGVMVGSELLVYGAAGLTAKVLFGLGRREALLAGFAAAFVNHVFLVLPIVIWLFGEAAALPIVAQATVDTAIIYTLTTTLLDLVAHKANPLRGALRATATNPALIAVAAGAAFNLLGLPFVKGLDLFSGFLGDAAAPSALIALGVILAGDGGVPTRRGLPWFLAGAKLVVHPLVALTLMTLAGLDIAATRPSLMVAAGPSATLAMVLATRYHLMVDSVARTILITTAVSLGTITLVALW